MGGAASLPGRTAVIGKHNKMSMQLATADGKMQVRKRGRVQSCAPPPDTFFGTELAWSRLTDFNRIGQGNYSVVYAASCDGYRVAVKRLYTEDCNEKRKAKIVSALQTECSLLQTVQHPHIVRFLGAVRTAPHFALVLELCECSVTTFLQTATKGNFVVTWDLLLDIATGAASAIRYLHTLDPQVLHRDIKADNLLLDSEFSVRVSDFGLSTAIPQMLDPQRLTCCGSMLWVAPEVMRGEPYDAAVDAYSYGVTMWELFNFELPFQGISASDIPFLVAEEGRRPERKPHVPQPLWELIVQCWDPIPESRPSFEQILDQLARMPTSFDTAARVFCNGTAHSINGAVVAD